MLFQFLLVNKPKNQETGAVPVTAHTSAKDHGSSLRIPKITVDFTVRGRVLSKWPLIHRQSPLPTLDTTRLTLIAVCAFLSSTSLHLYSQLYPTCPHVCHLVVFNKLHAPTGDHRQRQ